MELAQNQSTELLQQRRKRSSEQFSQLGFPHKKMERWRFTSLTDLAKLELSLPQHTGSLSTNELSALTSHQANYAFCHTLVLLDGKLAPAYSAPALASLQNLGVLLSTYPVDEHPHFEQQHQNSETFFNLYNWTHFQHELGLGLTFTKGTHLERPLHIIHVTGEQSAGKMYHPRLRISMQEEAQGQLVESHVSLSNLSDLSDHFLYNVITEIELHPYSQLDHTRLQALAPSVYHFSLLNTLVAEHAHYHFVDLTLGGRLGRNSTQVSLMGVESSAHLHGLYTLRGSQHYDHYLCVDHQAPHSRSSQLYKGILADTSQATFSGKIIVRPQAQKVEAQQLNKNILLHKTAHIHTQPQLEIAADDVKCSHGATIGQIRPEEIFYLQSRGLSPQKARTLLSHAFSNDVLLKISSPQLQQVAEQLLYNNFEQYTQDTQETQNTPVQQEGRKLI